MRISGNHHFNENFPCEVLFCLRDCYFVVDSDEGVMGNAENIRDVVFIFTGFYKSSLA